MENNETGKKCEDCGSGTCQGNCGNCNCPHHKAIPVFIILIALTFLAGEWAWLAPSSVAIIWPVLLGAIGVTKLMKSKCTCC
ncbi:MAG: hypothetical protein AAB649_05085 [Patescibacteria group bacterium]